MRKLSIAQVFIGLLLIALGITDRLEGHMQWTVELYFRYLGVWIGAWVCITGTLGIVASHRETTSSRQALEQPFVIPADEPTSCDVMTQGSGSNSVLIPVGDSSSTTPAHGTHSPAILVHTSEVVVDHPHPCRALKTVPLQEGGGEFVVQVSAQGTHEERPRMTGSNSEVVRDKFKNRLTSLMVSTCGMERWKPQISSD